MIIFSITKSEFLNTLTGEIGQLIINAPIDENRKISNLKNIFQIGNTNQLLLPASDEKFSKPFIFLLIIVET
jgi:hypothetical protein